MLIANSGVRVFEQPSLMLKRGSQYVITEHSSQGQRVEDAREHGIKHFWVAVDFVKGATPILPSRLEVDVDQSFSKELLELIHARFCEAMSWVAQDIATAPTSPKERRRRLLHCLVYSTEDYRPWSYGSRGRSDRFCNVETIDRHCINIYKDHGDVLVRYSEGTEKFVKIQELQLATPGVFVTEALEKSSLFSVYSKALTLNNWIVVEDKREFYLFGKAIEKPGWKGFLEDKDIYSERRQVFSETIDSPLNEIIRGDYAVINDDIFGEAAFVVLPSSLPDSWKRGEAAGYVRKAVTGACPPRVLINPRHRFTIVISHFVSREDINAAQRREMKLLLDSLCDSVIENERVSVARERLRTIHRDLRELVGGQLPEVAYSTLIIRP